jgi:fructose-1,6-bisphosphatase
MVFMGSEGIGSRGLTINPEFRRRAIALTRHNRPGTVPLPAYLGKPQMVIISDSHGEVNTYLKLYEALPSTIRYAIDLGDKIDRGPNPMEMNFLLQTLRVRRTLGNHDAMWLAAGLGIEAQSIELVRWLMRYNEVDFLTSTLGVSLKPLSDYAEKYFNNGSHRIDTKSKKYSSEEAAATYLKIIAEAPIRFPEHQETILNAAETRIRQALFLKQAANYLSEGERAVFSRLTGDQELDQADQALFYKLMGSVKDLNEEEKRVVDHFTGELLNNYEFYRFVSWMVGDGDLYFAFRTRQGYPVDILATHATIPVDTNGELAPFLGKVGRQSMLDLKNRIQLSMEAWRQVLEDNDPSLMQMHRDDVNQLALLPWDRRSPLYARQMQTAARAVLQEVTGTWAEPKEPFYTHFEKGKDPEMVARAKKNIADSFGFNRPDRLVIVNGHEPIRNKENPNGEFKVYALGGVLRIDAGMAKNYDGKGGALVFGTEGAGWLANPSLEFTQVPLPNPKHA